MVYPSLSERPVLLRVIQAPTVSRHERYGELVRAWHAALPDDAFRSVPEELRNAVGILRTGVLAGELFPVLVCKPFYWFPGSGARRKRVDE